MSRFIELWNGIMSVAVFAGLVVSLKLIYVLLLPRDNFSTKVRAFVSKYILQIGFLISLAAMVSSLVYSDIIGYPPCMFCWYARILFYPQVFIFGLALIRRDRNILPYMLVLSVLGILVGGYHSVIQLVGESALPCTQGGVSCITRDVYEYGFITIPFMGFVGFLAESLFLLIARRGEKSF